MPPTIRGAAFTTYSPTGILNSLINQCEVAPPFTDPAVTKLQRKYTAVWDTGASGSVITQAIVDALGLTQISVQGVYGVSGKTLAEVYMVTIIMPGGTAIFKDFRVTKGHLHPDIDLLIGMDIINKGDFSVSNFDGITKFSFRVPSHEHVDYATEINKTTEKRNRRNKTKGKGKGKGKGKRNRR